MNVSRFLGSFTTRGQIFVGVGVVIAVGAVLVGERDLLRIAVFVVALPPICALAIMRVPGNVAHTRELSPARVAVGGECRVVLTLTNSSAVLPTGAVLVEDRLPYSLGDPPRFTIARLLPGEGRTISYRLRSHMRGRYPIGPLTLRFTDPLGCAQFSKEVGAEMSLLVTPEVVELPTGPPRGDAATAGESRTRTAAGSGEDDVVPREYRHGDDLRRVHWRSTARRGRLMVRRQEPQWRDHSAVLLDARSHAYTGHGPRSALEGAVTMAASIAVHLLDLGQELRFVANATEISPVRRRDAVLDALAVTQPSPATSLTAGIALAGQTPVGGRGTLAVVAGALRAEEVEALAECHRDQTNGRVVVLTPGANWTSTEAADRAAERLAGAGWRVLRPAHPRELPALWGGVAADAR